MIVGWNTKDNRRLDIRVMCSWTCKRFQLNASRTCALWSWTFIAQHFQKRLVPRANWLNGACLADPVHLEPNAFKYKHLSYESCQLPRFFWFVFCKRKNSVIRKSFEKKEREKTRGKGNIWMFCVLMWWTRIKRNTEETADVHTRDVCFWIRNYKVRRCTTSIITSF